jgi:uncharacterized protein YdeI (YjbR/CyaY-like superfamily)
VIARPAAQEMNSKYPTLSFKSFQEWSQWLRLNHERSDGVWLRFFKKGSGISSVSHAEALDEALCYGWIDGQLKKGDEKSWLRKFTPRGPRSIWSKKNAENVLRLMKSGRMMPAGAKEIDAAKADGRWERAYDSAKEMSVPADFLREISKHRKAEAFFRSLNKANVYAIAWRLQTAKKPETRDRRMKAILEMMMKGQKLHAD